jgi:hypothetical protein
MRVVCAIAIVLAATAASAPAQADPYRWCAVYGGTDGDNGTSCYFMTLQQCQASVSGVGGFCTANQFYDGRPVTVPGETVQRRARARQ